MGCARNYHSGRDRKTERISRRIDKYHRHPEANCRRKTESREDWPATNHRISAWGFGSWRRSRSSLSELSSGREDGFSDAEHEKMARRMAFVKKQVHDDPYGALFGRRLGASYMEQNNARWPSFLWSFVDARPAPTKTPSKAHLQDYNFSRSQSSSLGNPDGLQYDPISGRMVPKPPAESNVQSNKASVDCPPGSEVEAKFASDPTEPEENQFRKPSAMVHSQKIECSPGNAPDAPLKTDPDTVTQAKATGVKNEEPDEKPNVNISCAPGSEWEALFVSESARTEKPQAETHEVKDTAAKHYGSDAGINTRGNVDCPPGSELEAKFSTQLSLGHHYGAPVEPSNIECAPGSEVEAKMIADAGTHFTQEAQPSSGNIDSAASIDCAPGSELEVLFTADRAAAKTAQQPPQPADFGNKKAHVTMDCAPGNELESLFVSEAATAGVYGETEDVSPLQASDIRARYITDVQHDGTEDRVGDFLAQKSKAANSSSAPFRILAYDAAASKVATSEADSFFGANEVVPPHEIFSRLHNPAKFVPYFEQMQQDGYDIATGGGDIIVFKKISHAPLNPIISPDVTARQEALDANIAKHIRHDSYDTVQPSHPSTFKPFPAESSSEPYAHHYSRAEGSSSSGSNPKPFAHHYFRAEDQPKSSPDSSFRKTFRRMALTGTVAGACCYAAGVVTEFFRTGGKDGYGIDGFTAFESERRHR
ncbi:hypothetical protein N7532_009221 [Penicillium argentinense]|uniref:Uncharacterized protein n=1 Tax=Penicillium argentinense TaxID=1131581 RepID=A0A9W9EYX1_9EURO|nr:uncharacterized protein N7532_009221 [Penicillium argentinense]KAJ5090537.1 hypothetical protein N7532_009221 [Penicillium argentinense]